ncbi:MAG TPA: right-handed parallel beta-helix repeat-containing protein [Phycisphaerae bacterium]|nr:right-handed parallel beta-helix repeat-containing protein [Phycisphaerae bacterium]
MRTKTALSVIGLGRFAGALMAMSLFLWIGACAQLTTSQQQASTTNIYVSPTGNDANPGTSDQPVLTLQRAQQLVRGENQNMSGDIDVYLAGGTYRLTQPLTLDYQDSGNNGFNVVYSAMPGQQPIISGAVQVTGWKLFDASKNIWSAPAPAGLTDTRQLYVDGVRAYRTRGRPPEGLTMTATGYSVPGDVMTNWRNPTNIEFVYTGGNAIWSEKDNGLGPWCEPRCPVAGITSDGTTTTITMAQPCWDNSTKRPEISASHHNLVGPNSITGPPEYIENAYELLGTPGEFYFDRSAGVIYYVPRPGEDLSKADVEAPMLEQLVTGNGTGQLAVHNIVFSGLQFAYATWLFPNTSEGFSEIQANYTITGADGYATEGWGDFVPGATGPYGAWTKAPANVSFSHDYSIQFLNDDFVHLGAAGLNLGDASQFDVVQGCVFTDISGNGIDIGGVDQPEVPALQTTSDNKVMDCHIYNVATEFHGGIGICVGYSKYTIIEHNQLDDLPYTAISMGWGGWPDKIGKAGVSNYSENALVSDNLIFNHMLLLADGGGIYTQGLTGPNLNDGEKLIGNVIYDQFSTGHGIYTDNGCANVTGIGNVMFHINHDNWGSRHKDYYNGKDGSTYDPFLFENNYWQQGDPDSNALNVTLSDNHLINTLDQVPASITQNAGIEPAYQNILNQQFGAPSAPEPPTRVAAYAGDGFVYVTWNPPVFTGGAPVGTYTINAPGVSVTIPAADYETYGYVQIGNLTDGQPYSFTVTATNANGTSSPSLPSLPVTPQTSTISVPNAPARVFAYPGIGMASIHIQAPAPATTGGPSIDGGSPIRGYVIIVEPTGEKVLFLGRKALLLGGTHTTFTVIDGLTSGQVYTFQVRALNAAGAGAAAQTQPIRIK